MSAITTHVLDVAHGRPAAGVAVRLERLEDNAWHALGSGATDEDGRCATLLPAGRELTAGPHRLVFETGAWWASRDARAFHPRVQVEFVVADPSSHHHVPLLLSPFGYTTYRGS